MRIESTMRRTVGRLALNLAVGAALAVCSAGCSTAGWGPPPPATAADVSTQSGAPRFVKTTGMRLTKAHHAVQVPPNIRVQDCGVVVISSPARYVCPNGKVYTTFQLARARLKREEEMKMASAGERSAPAQNAAR